MADRKRKSKRRSRSKQKRPLRKGFTLYLCHNLDYDEVWRALDKAGIRFKRHRDYFGGSADDVVLLKKVGKMNWILITYDKKQRTRYLERKLINEFKIREFAFTSGSLGNVGELLVKASDEMRSICKRHPGPFVGSISTSGHAYLRPDDEAALSL
jgi:hypothetical protein